MKFLLGFAFLWAVLAGTSALDPTARWGPLVLLAVVAASLIIRNRPLGLGRPDRRAMAVSAVVSGLVLLVWPVTVWVSGASIPLRPDWPIVLIGIICLHGLAEEMVWRGYVFRKLAERHSFWPAVWWSMPLIAVTHVPIVIASGPAVGFGAMAVAAVTSIAFSRLYVLGRGNLWAPGLLHVAIDSFKLVVLPAAALSVYPFLIIGFSLVIPLLVLLERKPRHDELHRGRSGSGTHRTAAGR